MKKFIAIFAAALLSATAYAATAFYTGERVTGMTKQCYYEYLGSEYVRTMRSIDICPLTIRV